MAMYHQRVPPSPTKTNADHRSPRRKPPAAATAAQPEVGISAEMVDEIPLKIVDSMDVLWIDFPWIFPCFFCINGFWFSCEDFKKLAGLSYEI
jgi:hypothetical protein